MDSLETLHTRRLSNWRQTAKGRIAGVDDAAQLIEALGLVTLYPVSSEVPNLYHAFMGDPAASTDSNWDSPSGEVYTWRWLLGRREAAFYSAVVRKRPTWIRWDLLPAVLRLCGELRTPDELVDAGVISQDAYRVAQALENAGGVLNTAELRARAGFPTGKEQRAAYLKAVEELDSRLLLAKMFAADGDQMSHALVAERYRDRVTAAERLSRDDALEQLLLVYLPMAVYAAPTVLARHLGIPESELRAGQDHLVADGKATRARLAGQKGECYVWQG